MRNKLAKGGPVREENIQTGGGWLDNFIEYVKQSIDIIQLNEDALGCGYAF